MLSETASLGTHIYSGVCLGENVNRLPPGQREIERIPRWGRDHAGISATIPHIDREKWTLSVEGEVEKPTVLDWVAFLSLGVKESISDFHCVEGWSILGCKWQGVPFRRLAELVKPSKEARFMSFSCYDGYTTSLPLEVVLEDNVLLACKLDGKWLEPDLGGPVRLIVPKKYAYKSAMWIKTISFMKTEQLGYWESRGYSNTADPWKNDRWT